MKVGYQPIKTQNQSWIGLFIFPRLILGNRWCFPALWRRLHVFPRFAPDTRFPAFGTNYMFVGSLLSVLIGWLCYLRVLWLANDNDSDSHEKTALDNKGSLAQN